MSEREMSDLLALIERKLGAQWIDLITWLRDHNALDEIDRRLAAGDMAGVIASVEDAAAKYATDIQAAFTLAGQRTAQWLDGMEPDSIIRFDATNDRAVAWAEQNKMELVRGFTQEQRETTSRVITSGVRDGRNPLEVARDLRGSIGLTPSQADAVQSYRRALESGDYRNAINRALSDGRHDRGLETALRDGTAIDPSKIDTMVDRYRTNYVNYRAEVIARTEGLRALHAGNEELFRQAIDNGDIDADSLVREWNHAGHGRNSRPGHIHMRVGKVKIGEKFVTGDGNELRYPGDPEAPPEETIQCRCAVSTRYAA